MGRRGSGNYQGQGIATLKKTDLTVVGTCQLFGRSAQLRNNDMFPALLLEKAALTSVPGTVRAVFPGLTS